MTHAISLEPAQGKSDHAALQALAKETDTSVDVVRVLYNEQIALLSEHATIKQFIGVIATRRVKQQLRRGNCGKLS